MSQRTELKLEGHSDAMKGIMELPWNIPRDRKGTESLRDAIHSWVFYRYALGHTWSPASSVQSQCPEATRSPVRQVVRESEQGELQGPYFQQSSSNFICFIIWGKKNLESITVWERLFWSGAPMLQMNVQRPRRGTWFARAAHTSVPELGRPSSAHHPATAFLG